ncbi:hypothetical protein ACQP1G_43840 [Nocardia sp. CA-107356]|uniref:hypothetical protein n=1 Tax=Nocardia sp. CA-107356 TaxID=3239972 RepID=UPI003D935361
MTTSRDELIKQIVAIRSSQSDIGNLPEVVQDWHGHIVAMIRANGYGGVLTGNFGSALTTEDLVDKIWDNRDKINNALGETWDKLVEINPGLEVPVKFIEYADEWRKMNGDIINATTAYSETALYTEWQGDASNRYRDMRDRQKIALDSTAEVCLQIAVSLETVAKNELTLYTDLATKAQDLVSKVTALTGSYIKSAFDFPMGWISASTDLVSAVQASKTFILGITKSVADNAQSNMIEGNKIHGALVAQRGLPANKWPPAVVESYGKGIEGVRVAIGDASVTATDGDKSDWTI